MPITDPNHPLMQHAERVLKASVARLARRHGTITQQFHFHLSILLQEHQERARRGLGVEFPRLTVMMVPRLNIIELARADLDPKHIRTAVLNFIEIHKRRGLEQIDVVEMIRRAWPHIKKLPAFDMVDEGTHIARERVRKAYIDETCEERACGHCGRPYRGPAGYCSLECAQSDA